MENISARSPRMLIIIGGSILALILIIIVVLSAIRNQNQQSKNNEQPPITGNININPQDNNPNSGTATVDTNRPAPPVPGVIVKVGNELLYEEDLNYELAYYPPSNSGEPEEILIKKMIDDSVILQSAEKEGLIELDNKIYNSSDKDYEKRTQTVLQLKDKIDEKSTQLEGSVISLWFHNMQPGDVGYTKGKQIAQAEMSRLLVDLNAKKITMQQAGEQIRANQSLAQVDASWEANSFFEFAISNNQKITYSPEIDKQIYRLNSGQISELLVGKDIDPETGKKIDAVYMIAQVTNRSTNPGMSYDTWLEENREKYEITRY